MGAEDWERFEKTSDPNDRRWIDGLLGAIWEELSGPELNTARSAGVAFELLCAELLNAQLGVATVERASVGWYDGGTDLTGRDNGGRPTWYMQCKLRSPGGRKGRTSIHDVARWASQAQAQVMSNYSGVSNVTARAVWVTTGPVDDVARRHIASVNSASPVQFEIWDPDTLCQRLLTTRGLGFVKADLTRGTEEVVVDREALRGFRQAAEAELGGSAIGDSRTEAGDVAEEANRPRFLPPAERRQALEEVLRDAEEPMPVGEVLAKAGEWLGLSEAERRYAEPGTPIPLFEWLISLALEDLREDGVVKRHGGQRWSLSHQQGSVSRATFEEFAAAHGQVGGETRRPRFLSPVERRQALGEVLRAADEPLPFEELLSNAGERLGLSEGEQRFAEPGKPMPLFEWLISQALEDLRQEGAAELQSGRRWSITSDGEPAAKAGAAQEPLNGGAQVVRPRYLPPTERRQAIEEVLRAADEPMPFGELLAKAGAWLGLSEGEQRFAEPGKPMPLFEWLISQALEDLRQEGTAELQSGRRWSLSADRGSATKPGPTESGPGGVSDRAGEAARPRFLSPAERQLVLEEVLRDAEAPMPITEVLAKAGEWLGVSESEQRYAEPGRPTPLFEHLMLMALEDLREAGVVERHGGRRWSLAGSAEPRGRPIPLFEHLISQALHSLRDAASSSVTTTTSDRWMEEEIREPVAGESRELEEATRPRDLPPAERRQALEEVLRDVEVPMSIAEVLVKAGEHLGLTEAERRYVEPGTLFPRFELLMSMTLEAMREDGAVQLHNGGRWSFVRQEDQDTEDADWVWFEKTTAPDDRGWIEGVTRTIRKELASERLADSRASGAPFELLCTVLLNTASPVEKVERIVEKYDWHTDLVGKNRNGQITRWLQCKLWGRGGRKNRAVLNAVSAWITKVEQAVDASWAGRPDEVNARAVWITTAEIDPRAARMMKSQSHRSKIAYELWEAGDLCQVLLDTPRISFVKSDITDGVERVGVNREALRAFKQAAESELGEALVGKK